MKDEKKKNPVLWGFFKVERKDSLFFYARLCHQQYYFIDEYFVVLFQIGALFRLLKRHSIRSTLVDRIIHLSRWNCSLQCNDLFTGVQWFGCAIDTGQTHYIFTIFSFAIPLLCYCLLVYYHLFMSIVFLIFIRYIKT